MSDDEQILEQIYSTHVHCNQQIEDIDYDQRLRKLFETPTETEVTEVLKVLIFPKDAPQSLFHGVTNTTVDITVLKNKNIYLFISTLDITEEEFSVVRSVYESIKTNEQYKIVWIPMVEEWNAQLRKKFDSLKSEIPWYVVQNFEIVRGYKYIQKEWVFKKKPMVVVLSSQGKIENYNAFRLIQDFGINAFPFTYLEEDKLRVVTYYCATEELNWVGPVVGNFNSRISKLKKEDKYIFFYGGNDKEWIQQFIKYATILANDATIKEANISVELVFVGKEDRSVKSKLWNGIQSLFMTKAQRTVDSVTQELHKMLTFKNETGWALLSQGSSLVVSGHGTTIFKTVFEFEQWKQMFVESGSFELSFKEYHKSVSTIHRCTHLEIPMIAKKLMPETIRCPDCPNTMDIFISYKCFHTAANAKSCTHLEIPIVAGKLPEPTKCPDCPNTMEIFITYKCWHNNNTIADAKN